MHFKERRHEIAKQNNRIFTHIAFITDDINPGYFIGGITVADGVIVATVVPVRGASNDDIICDACRRNH